MSLNACNPESISYFVLISIYIEKASANYHFTWKFNCFLFSYISALLHIGSFLDLRIFNSSNINFQGLQLGKLSYVFIDSLSCYIPSINFKDFLSHRKEFILISSRCDTDVPQGGNGFKWVVFAKSLELVRCSHEKWIKNHTETVYLENFHAECEL